MVRNYLIHDNFARPFKVVVKGTHVDIYKGEQDDYKTLVKEYDADKVFIGKSSGRMRLSDHTVAQAKNFIGNSILLKVGKSYVYVGDKIYQFTPTDEIEDYYSLVGNNDVPYPVALGKENVYFMLDKKYVPRVFFPEKMDWENAYQEFIGAWDEIRHKWVGTMDRLAKKMKKVKMIQERIF